MTRNDRVPVSGECPGRDSTPEGLLSRLVAFPTLAGRSNSALIDFIRDYLAAFDVSCAVISGPEGDRFCLFATIGPAEKQGYILSGHLDVVPAEVSEWRTHPFVLRQESDRLIGRGSCDMKGFVAAVLSTVPELVDMNLSRPIHIALSYDKEFGCRGVPHLINRLPILCQAPLGCIVGEPTNLTPVLAHKGKTAIRVSARGLSGNSSRPDQGDNAIHNLIPILTKVHATSSALEAGPLDDRFEPQYSTLQVGVIDGGKAINILPDKAEAIIELRAVPGIDPAEILSVLYDAVTESIEIENIATYPSFSLQADHPLANIVQELTSRPALHSISFGTEAGFFQQAEVPTIVCGPGDNSRAHQPEEFLTINELQKTCGLVLSLGSYLCN